MKKGIIKKGIQFYKRYGIRGGIATLTGQGQIKDKNIMLRGMKKIKLARKNWRYSEIKNFHTCLYLAF